MVSAKNPVLYTFVESVVFTRQLQDLASIETLYAIQADLLADPERWPVIPGTKGARKGRVADPRSSRGKARQFPIRVLVSETPRTNLSSTDVW